MLEFQIISQRPTGDMRFLVIHGQACTQRNACRCMEASSEELSSKYRLVKKTATNGKKKLTDMMGEINELHED